MVLSLGVIFNFQYSITLRNYSEYYFHNGSKETAAYGKGYFIQARIPPAERGGGSESSGACRRPDLGFFGGGVSSLGV